MVVEQSNASSRKKCLLETLRARVAEDLATLVRRQKDTVRGATHEDSRSEHAKDTRAAEQSYLARGLAERVENLRESKERLARLEPTAFHPDAAIGLGALVVLFDIESKTLETWWIVPVAGGIDLRVDEENVRTVTPAAPLGRCLIGLCAGDDGEFRTPKGPRSFEIRQVG